MHIYNKFRANRCPYNTICELQDAGFDLEDCCQDVRTDGPCTADLNMVSCGAPGGKQCTYDNQCNANASGYNEKQCCPAASDGVVCTMVSSRSCTLLSMLKYIPRYSSTLFSLIVAGLSTC